MPHLILKGVLKDDHHSENYENRAINIKNINVNVNCHNTPINVASAAGSTAVLPDAIRALTVGQTDVQKTYAKG
jgi:hypothetical protein